MLHNDKPAAVNQETTPLLLANQSRKTPSFSPLEALPTEVVVHSIAPYLDRHYLITLGQASKSLREKVGEVYFNEKNKIKFERIHRLTTAMLQQRWHQAVSKSIEKNFTHQQGDNVCNGGLGACVVPGAVTTGGLGAATACFAFAPSIPSAVPISLGAATGCSGVATLLGLFGYLTCRTVKGCHDQEAAELGRKIEEEKQRLEQEIGRIKPKIMTI